MPCSCEREELARHGNNAGSGFNSGQIHSMWQTWGTAVSTGFERSGIHQITRDHSYVEAMVSLGQMSRGSREYRDEEKYHYPRSRDRWACGAGFL